MKKTKQNQTFSHKSKNYCTAALYCYVTLNLLILIALLTTCF